MLDFLIPAAYAQQGPAAPQAAWMNIAFPLVLIVVFYFMLIRPQMKRGKESREMLQKLAKGDEVVTSGGLAGRIVNLGEVYLSVEIADGVQVKVQKSAISSVLPKGTLKVQ